MSSEPAPTQPGRLAISVNDLGKRYELGRSGGPRYRSAREDLVRRLRPGRGKRPAEDRTFWALRHVTFEVSAGERVGIIGRNGAGKSTLLKILSRITLPTEGRARVVGRVASLLEVGTGFHPELSGRDNILLSAAVHGMSRREIERRTDEIIEFAGVERFLDTPVKRYSSGMYLRLAFSVAAHLDPDILLVDEVLAVGDADFQKKCLGRMAEVSSGGRTVVFVSHSMPAILRLCERAILLDAGGVVADGVPHEVVRAYLESGGGSRASIEWERLDEAPGDDVARLRAVRVTSGGVVADEIDVRRAVDVEVEYWHVTEDNAQRPTVALYFFNEDGVCLFFSADFSNTEWRSTQRRRGTVRSSCRIPANFLAEGRIYVAASLCSHDLKALHVVRHDVVSFLMVDREDGEGVRGDYGSEWFGVVRPMLNWSIAVTPLDEEAAGHTKGAR